MTHIGKTLIEDEMGEFLLSAPRSTRREASVGAVSLLGLTAPVAAESQANRAVAFVDGQGLEPRAIAHAVSCLVPGHLAEVRKRREHLVDKTRAAVKDRLTKEINYRDHRAEDLRVQEQAGKQPRMNSAKVRQRADEQTRLQKRLPDLELERPMSALPPVVMGAALVVPTGLLKGLGGEPPDAVAREAARVEKLAMEAVMAAERALGHEPRDVGALRCGYDIESRPSDGGSLRLIEVKGRHKDAKTIGVTRNEILAALNEPDRFLLVVVLDGELVGHPQYVPRPLGKEPDFGVTDVSYSLSDLLVKAHSQPTTKGHEHVAISEASRH